MGRSPMELVPRPGIMPLPEPYPAPDIRLANQGECRSR